MATWSLFSIQLAERWRAIDPAWRWAIGVFAAARIFYTLWAAVILLLVPTVTQNLDLFGNAVVATFDLNTSARYVYSRIVDGQALSFSSIDGTHVADVQTQSVWDLEQGRAVQGAYTGTELAQAIYDAEDVFPYRGVEPSPIPLIAIWQRFDTNWFLQIAQRGYATGDGSTVYMPLYPIAIRFLGTLLFGNYMLAALLISNLSLVAALVLLFRMTHAQLGVDAARRVLVYLILFPTAFFFFAAYTESLFLALALASLFTAQKQKYLLAGVLGALAALTRLQGVLLIIPLAYLVWEQTAGLKLRFSMPLFRGLLPLLLIPFATMGFLAYANLSLIASYEGELHARFVMPWENLGAAVQWISTRNASLADISNLIVTLLFGGMCVVVWRRMPRALAIYTVLMFLVPLFRMTTTQPLVSMTRYALVLFPVFMVWAGWGKNPWVNRAIVYPCFLANLYFSAQFFLWGWVA